MLGRLLEMLGLRSARSHAAPADLRTVDREKIAHLIRTEHGLPHVDWGAADAWIGQREPDGTKHDGLRRAIAAAWLDELRDTLRDDHRRWRHAAVEGVAPLDDAPRVARAADRAIQVVGAALHPVRTGPISPLAVIALSRSDDYYSFISHYYPDEGQWGTSGGVCINDGPDSFPMVVLPLQVRWSVEHTIAHELTHHALRGLELPLWIEEGLTQMMEERVTGQSNFRLDGEMMQRHRGRWPEIGLERFWSGDSFHSPEEDEQELSYHLAQLLVRRLLAERPGAFFAFVRACAADGADSAAHAHLGCPFDELTAGAIGVPSAEED